MIATVNPVRVEILKRFPTQSDFAQAAGVHESTVSKILRGRKRLDPAQAKHWAKVIGCELCALESVTTGG